MEQNDAIWARFFRDGKTLHEIAQEFNCGINDLEFLIDRQTKIIDYGAESKRLIDEILKGE